MPQLEGFDLPSRINYFDLSPLKKGPNAQTQSDVHLGYKATKNKQDIIQRMREGESALLKAQFLGQWVVYL